MQIKAAHYKSQKHHQSILQGGGPSGGPLLAAGPPPNMISQSALANYSNVQNILQQHSNRGAVQQQNVSGGQQVKRPSSRKKQSAAQNLIYDQQNANHMYPSLNNGGAPQSTLYMQKNASHHNNSSTIEGLSKDQLNESSNFLSDDPLMKSSNPQLMGVAAVNSTGNKAKHQQHYYQSLQDESYLDASVYEQFIQGPHNISQFTAAQAAQDMNSYSQYIQRPLSQNTNLNAKSAAQNKLGRQSPANGAQKTNTTRTVNQQIHSSNQNARKSSQQQQHRAASSIMHNSLNNSGQKPADRRLMVGRTPSPNFLKRIAGLMNIGNDFILPQQNLLYKNVGGGAQTNLIVGQAKQRSQSKQAFSSNPGVSSGAQSLQQSSLIHYNPQQAQNFIHLTGVNTIQSLDKSLKQKFLKQQTSTSNASQSSVIGNANRFKSGSLTTSSNTAQNSPRSGQPPLQRNQAKQQRSTGKSNSSAYASNTDFHQISESMKKNQMVAQVLSQQVANPQQKLKHINEIEEKKALALVKGIKDYPSATHQKQQFQLQQQYLQHLQQQNHQSKHIGDMVEEDPQPLIDQHFMDGDKQSFHSVELHNNYFPNQQQQQPKQQKTKKQQLPGHRTNSKSISHTPSNQHNMIVDGGTGSNGAQMGNEQQYRGGLVNHPPTSISSNDPNSISLYLDQLQSLRQGQKSQLSQYGNPIIPQYQQNMMMSPMTVNKTAQNFYKQQMPKHQQQQYMSGMPSHQINIKPLLQSQQKNGMIHTNHSKSVHEEESAPLSIQYNNKNILNPHIEDSNRGVSQEPKYQQKKKPSIVSEPPKITTPSVEMYQMNNKNSNSNNNSGKPPHQPLINFNGPPEKTPFEKELDQKASEIKNMKKLTQEQIKLQKYKEDSISLLKQLQESGSIVITGDMKEQSLHSKKNSVVDQSKNSKQLKIDMIDNKKSKKPMIQIGGPAAGQLLHQHVNSPKNNSNQRPPNTLADEEEDEIMITQEEEQQIKEVISDLNEKAFYGKMLKRSHHLLNPHANDESVKHLSPRSREIALVMRMIKSSFDQTSQPPITTTDFYRIGKMLGRGAFGKVNLSMHKLVRKLVAMKSLNKECLTDELQKQKLMKEVSLLLKLRHNHVVKIYETIETEKHIIIVMELCAGGDLLNYVRKRRRLKEPYAKVIFKQIIDGLCYIHSKFIAHRDIKLDNILLDGKGNVKIADFGVSKQCQRGQLKMTEQCGTPAYIAPEILKDKGYTFSVDLWSAGVVLFAMLYGTVPFKANNMEELHKLIVKGKYVLKDDISIEARNLLRGLLEVNPEKRLTIKQIYKHKWFADLDPSLQLFNDLEREMIRKEYTYNDPRRYNRNENEEPVDCFTEHNLESVYNSLKNVTSKSIILAPFNSTQSQIMEEGKLRESVSQLVCEKMIVLKFARRCREIDRQYEFNNNGELDNGVYHKFINNSDEEGGDDSGDDRANGEDVDKDLLCIPMLMSSRRGDGKKGGKSSVENSFDEDLPSMKRLQDKQQIALKIKEGSTLQKELHRNRKNLDNEIDAELVQTFEEYQARYSGRLDQDKINKLVHQGYPREYVMKTLEENDPNYCTAGYYLMCMDQNYC